MCVMFFRRLVFLSLIGSVVMGTPVRALTPRHARGSLSFQASPGGLLAPVGCPVCLALEGFPVTSCTVLFV